MTNEGFFPRPAFYQQLPACQSPNMPTLKTAFILLLVLSPASAADSDFGWKLDRGYKYLWVRDKEKIGETVFRFTRKEGIAGNPDYYQLASRKKMDSEGRIEDSSGTLLFSLDGTPLSYHEETGIRLSSQKAFTALRETRIRFENGRVNSTITNNGEKDNASKKEIAVDKDTFLFSTLRQEQWNLFTGKLDNKKPVSLKIFYPEFGEVMKIEFRPEVESAPLRIGEREIPVSRFAFEAKKWKWKGTIWVDSKGRMLQYTSGPLKIVLTGKID